MAVVRRLVLWFLAGVLAAPAHAAAQTTRAAEIRAEREAKARQLEPYKRGTIEAVLFRIENDLLVERVLNPPRGIYLRLGGIGEGAGFGAGPAYRYSTGRFDFTVSAAGSLKRYGIGEAKLRFPGTIAEDPENPADGPYLELYARRRDFPQEDFFGIGPQSLDTERTNFALRDTVARAAAGWRSGDLTAGIGAGWLSPSIGSGTDSRMPSIEEVFAPAEVPGLADQPAFIVIDPFVEYDFADPPLNPTTGGRYRVSFARYSDRDLDRFSFNRWDVDLRQYVPFFHRTRTIALRAFVSSSNPDAGNDVPFYLEPTLGGARSLRGFRTFRFRDRAALLLQAEYRWRINEFVYGALFYDTGAVAPRLRDVGSLERNYGFGVRAGGRGGVVFRIDLALGGESTRLLLRFDDVF